jgi:hypothetical protein
MHTGPRHLRGPWGYVKGEERENGLRKEKASGVLSGALMFRL